MWQRNLLFGAVIAFGAVALGWLLFPPAVPKRAKHFDRNRARDREFTDVVAEIDSLFEESWQDADIKPTQDAPSLAIARRTSLALTGRVPSLQEIRQFEAPPEKDYTTQELYQWWLEGIFEDPRFGDHMAERLARATVGVDDGNPFVYRRGRYTAWLSDEFMRNRPYDDLVRELISTNGFATDRPASNFILSTLNPAEKNTPDRVRLASKTSRAFLGIRLDCAQCHDHPFQPWKKDDFAGLAAYYGEVDFGFTGVYEKKGSEYRVLDKQGDKHVVQPAVPANPELLPQQGTRREKLAAWITHKDNPYFAKATVNRIWALLFGQPLIAPVDDIGTVLLEKLDDAPLSDPRRLQREVLNRLARDFIDHNFDLRRLIRVIVALRVYRLDSSYDEEYTDAHEAFVSVMAPSWVEPMRRLADERADTREKLLAVFPMTRLRSDQVALSLLQSCSLTTINRESHFLVRFKFSDEHKKFVERYGDSGEDDFEGQGGTIPQRLLLMNGNLVKEHTGEEMVNASSRVAALSPNDPKAIEIAYLTTLTRRPTPEEREHFERRLSGHKKAQALEDLFWSLLNSTEFAWNH